MDYQVRFLTVESTIIDSLLDIQNTLTIFNTASQKTEIIATHVFETEKPSYQADEDLMKHWFSPHKLQNLTVLVDDALEDSASISQLKIIAKNIKKQIAQKLTSIKSDKNPSLKEHHTSLTAQKLKLGKKQNAILLETQKLREELHTLSIQIKTSNPGLYQAIASKIHAIDMSLKILERHNIPNPQNLSQLSARELYNILKGNKIEDPEMILLFLRKIAIKDPEFLLAVVLEFKLDEEKIYDLAFVLTRHQLQYLKRFIELFKIQNEEPLSLFALGCAITNPLETVENIQIFHLKDAEIIKRIGQTCCEKDPRHAPSYLHKLALPRSDCCLFLLLLAQKHPASVVAFIDKYPLLDENDRIEIALTIAFYRGDLVAEFLPRFKIDNAQAQYKVAMKCAQNNGTAVARFFEHFHAIEEEQQQAEIAKVAAQENGAGLSEYIGHFKAVRTPSLLQDILFNAAKSSGKGTTRYIRNYIKLGVNDPNLLFKVATLCLCQDPEGTSLYFLRFEIEDAQNRYKLALLGAKKDGFAVASYFRNFQLTDQEQIFEVAKACARQNGLGFAIRIGNFGITNQQQLITLAKTAAKQDPEGLSSSIQSFKIEEEKERVAIALTAANFADMHTHESNVPRFIKNYAIQSEEDRARIALVLARTCGKKLLEHLDKFNLSTSTYLSEIITTALTYTWIRVLSQATYNEKDWDVSTYLPIMIHSKELLGFLTQFSYLPLIRVDAKEKEIKTIYKKLRVLMSDELKLKSYQTMVFDHIYQGIQDFSDQQRCLCWMIPLMMIMRKRPEVTKLLTERHFVQILKHVAELSQSALRGKCTAILIEMCFDNRLLSVWLALRVNLEIKTKKDITEFPSQIQLAALALAPLADLSERLRMECETTLSFIQDKRSYFRSSRNLRDFLELIFLLIKYSHQSLAPSEIVTFLKIINSAAEDLHTFSKTICMLKDIIHFGRLEKAIGLQDHTVLAVKMQEIFQEEFDIGDINDFTTRYYETFGKFRSQDAVLTYGNRLRSISRHEALLFNEYVQTVLAHSFLKARYQLEKNPHLRFLDHKLPGLLKIWRQGDKAKAVDLLSPENFTLSPRQNPKEYLRIFITRKIGQEKRLTPILKADYPFLERSILILQSRYSEEEENKKLKFERENLKLQLDALNKNKPITRENGPLKNRLSIESLFLNLLIPDLSQTEIYKTIEQLIHLVPKKNLLSKDLNDIWKDLTVDMSTSRLCRLTVEDTDDPCDLLLLCTEVSSCLDINGDPEISKCLQAYLLDGKIRALAVKNEKGHIIARCVLRLLWDQKEEAAVIFQERAYTSDPDPLLAKLLRAMAKKRAESLSVALVGDSGVLSVQNGNYSPYPNPLRSLKSKAPFEYVDALEGIVEAPYEIGGAALLYNPSNEGIEKKV